MPYIYKNGMFQFTSEEQRPSRDEEGNPIMVGDRPYLSTSLPYAPKANAKPGLVGAYEPIVAGQRVITSRSEEEKDPEDFSSAEQYIMFQKAQESKDPEDMDWWKKEKDYTDWLTQRGLAYETLGTHAGNNLYKEYVTELATKTAENSLLSPITNALGEFVQNVSGIVNDIPIVKEVVKPIGSMFKFVGNLLDMPRNILAGLWTGVATGHLEDVPQHTADAFMFGISAGTRGENFSWGDFMVHNKVENLEKSMSKEEFKAYTNSDDWRQNKRMFQMGGLLADLVLDPMWLLGAGQNKVMGAIKSMSKEFPFLEKIKPILSTGAREAGFVEQFSTEWNHFMKRADTVIPTVMKDSKLKGVFNLDATLSNAENAEKMITRAREIMINGLPDLDSYGYKIRLYNTPFTKKRDWNIPMSPSFEPIKRVMLGKFASSGVVQDMKALYQGVKDSLDIKSFTGQDQPIDKLVTQHNALVEMIKKEKAGGKLAELADDNIPELANYLMNELNPNLTIYRLDLKPEQISATLKKYSGDISKIPKQDLVSIFMTDQNYKKMLRTNEAKIKSSIKALDRIKGTTDPNLEKIRNVHAKLLKERDLLVGDQLFVNAAMEHHKFKMPGTDAIMKNNADTLFSIGMNELKGLLSSKEVQDIKGTLSVLSKDIIAKEKAAFEKVYKVAYEEEIGGLNKFMYKNQKKQYDKLLESNPNLTVSEFLAQGFAERKATRFLTDYMQYVPNITTPEAKKYFAGFAKKLYENESTPLQFLDEMTLHAKRQIILPTDFTDQHFIQRLFAAPGETDPWGLKKVTALLQDGSKESLDEAWHIVMNRTRSISDDLFMKLTNTDKFGRAAVRGLDGWEPMLEYVPAGMINKLSEKGLIFRGFNGKVFKTGVAPMYERIKRTNAVIGRTEAAIGIWDAGVRDGWLKKFGKYDELTSLPKYLGVHEWARGEGWFTGYAVPRFLEDKLVAFQKGVQGMLSPLEAMKNLSPTMQKGLDFVKFLNQWWVANAYFKHPSSHARNFITNSIMMLGEGIGLNFWDESAKHASMLHAYKRLIQRRQRIKTAYFEQKIGYGEMKKALSMSDPKHIMNKTVRIGDNQVPVPEAMDLFLRHHVDGGFSASLMQDETVKMADKDPFIEMTLGKLDGALAKAYPDTFKKYNFLFGKDDKYTNAMRGLADRIENEAGRYRLFFHYVNNNSMSLPEAAARVNHVLIDYSRMAAFEKPLKQYLMPFYIWQSRMLGVMARKAFEQPTLFTKMIQLRNDSYKMLELDESFSPQYEKTVEGLPMLTSPKDIAAWLKGKPMSEIQTKFMGMESFFPQAVVNVVNTNPYDLVSNPSRFFSQMFQSPVMFGAKQITPFFKLPLELTLNYSLFFGKKIEDFPGETEQYLGMMLPSKQVYKYKQFGGLMKEIDMLTKTDLPIIGGAFDPNPYSGRKYHVADFLLSQTGVVPKVRDEVSEVRNVVRDLEERYRKYSSSAKYMENAPKEAAEYAKKTMQTYYALAVMKFYREWLLEQRDSGRAKLARENQEMDKKFKAEIRQSFKTGNFDKLNEYVKAKK